MVIGRERIGNKNRGLSHHLKLGHSPRARARNHKICLAVELLDISYEVEHLRPDSPLLILLSYTLDICFAGLMDDPQRKTFLLKDFCRSNNRFIERACPLRASQN